MSETPLSFPEVFNELSKNGGLSPARVRAVFATIFAGDWSTTQIAAFLGALRMTPDNPETIAAAANAMRDAMVKVEHGLPLVLDTCGTGGDHSSTLNVSTGAAIIAAAAGVPVAKHGNRAATSKSGSADVLESLGIPLDVPPAAQAKVLASANIAFLFAPAHHPATRHSMPARRELGIRTLFNCLGPLANPAGATHQLVGAFDHGMRGVMARALATLGTRRSWVVRSEDGMDEVSPFGVTCVTAVTDGAIEEFEIVPEDFGMKPSAEGAIRGGEPAENARVLQEILDGVAHPAVDAFVLNAAAALVVAEGLAPRLAAQKAREALVSGAAKRTLQRFREAALAAKQGA